MPWDPGYLIFLLFLLTFRLVRIGIKTVRTRWNILTYQPAEMAFVRWNGLPPKLIEEDQGAEQQRRQPQIDHQFTHSNLLNLRRRLTSPQVSIDQHQCRVDGDSRKQLDIERGHCRPLSCLTRLSGE